MKRDGLEYPWFARDQGPTHASDSKPAFALGVKTWQLPLTALATTSTGFSLVNSGFLPTLLSFAWDAAIRLPISLLVKERFSYLNLNTRLILSLI